MTAEMDPREFRRVLGHVPTGVVVVTAMDADDSPVGMVIGSFISVSLDPPLVGFLPGRTSGSFARIRSSDRFCVNVLAADQEGICRAFTGQGGRFDETEWDRPEGRSPHLGGSLAWIDCTLESIIDAGDHFVVLGRVEELAVARDALPLVFFQGGYGRFATHSLAAAAEPDLVSHLRMVDHARPAMERVAAATGLECLATAAVGDEVVALATSGSRDGTAAPTRVGQRMPFLPPLGAPLVAWSEPATEDWLGRSARSGVAADANDVYRAGAARVRDRGWSIGLGPTPHLVLDRALSELPPDPTPAQRARVLELVDALGEEYEIPEIAAGESYPVRTIGVPVFDPAGDVVLMITGYGFSQAVTGSDIDRCVAALRQASEEITEAMAAASTGPLTR